jgi:hypothetical protein
VSERIRFSPKDRKGLSRPAAELRVEGWIVPDIAARPREIHFGRHVCGTTAEEAVCLRSLTGRAFHVDRSMSGDDRLAVSTLSTHDAVYSIRCRFASTGEWASSVVFVAMDDSGHESRVVVPVRYHGTAPP